MLPRDERLSTAEFSLVWEKGRVLRHPLFAARAFARNDELAGRIAFVVPRKSGKATARNRLRRRVRECYRLSGARTHLRGQSVVFVLNAARAEAPSEEWTRAFEEMAARIARAAPNSKHEAGNQRTQRGTDGNEDATGKRNVGD
ncbi:MAG TPA: ribonuclease P protein component [Abditibacteriaceae bacterium]|jgi:ribonuclease P protein component